MSAAFRQCLALVAIPMVFTARAGAEPPALQATLKGHSDQVRCVAFGPGDRTLASGSWDETIKVWDLSTRKNILSIKQSGGAVEAVAFVDRRNRLLSGAHSRTVQVWDLDDGGKAVGAFRQSGPRSPAGSAPSSSKAPVEAVYGLCVSPDGKRIIICGDSPDVLVWTFLKGGAFLKGHQAEVYCVAYSPDSENVASAGYDGARLWRVGSARNSAVNAAKCIELTGPASPPIHAVAFSPDGKTLASAGRSKQIDLWNASDGKHVRALEGHSLTVFCLVFSKDSKTLISGGKDATMRLWNTMTGESLGVVQAHEGAVHSLALSSDGATLASAGADKTIKLWQMHGVRD
jgi:WD40 repeat protein